MANQAQQADFFWRIYLPIALLAAVLFGFPWLAMKISDHQTASEAEQVQGRAPGLSEHASPFGKTEARAQHTLDPARTETASARECGECFSPRAPEPSAARVG
ncbi:hypothetical protein PSJM300_14875 [Stutzerimonas stutzeri DSM 10701]|uniref:hypothetical protein n=1 Tax=Stutzerimonas nitrititolerans TaxID=2482751 RepID=UPI00026D70A0|nr:hypothetical protein [Stutzerimonas nitrititolerans]AFN79037.1 hypothetical protein PSJM300_14875 [Stutzerimonas stutzeri DSM 10701]